MNRIVVQFNLDQEHLSALEQRQAFGPNRGLGGIFTPVSFVQIKPESLDQTMKEPLLRAHLFSRFRLSHFLPYAFSHFPTSPDCLPCSY